jgi:DNA-binding NtrC family response regulator
MGAMIVNGSATEDTPILLGDSRVMLALRGDIEQAARCTAKVLIIGETGAGKEVVARCIHRQSTRARRPFAAVNCGGIPETLLESELFGHVRGSFTDAHRDHPGLIRQAHGGTLFLDELGEMSLRMQAMLLRFADTGEMQPVGALGTVHDCDVRLITATNSDLRAQIEAGTFRQDLYYRLNVIQICVPPLRNRADDVPVLLEHYLRRASLAHGLATPHLDSSAVDALIAYPWPGNVRELKNMTERLVLEDVQRPITADDLHLGTNRANRTITAEPPSDSSRVEQLWQQLEAGQDFWSVVYQPFKNRELTRRDVTELIQSGLSRTSGSYRSLLALFNLSDSDYKRFHAFLRQQNCNLDARAYRRPGIAVKRRALTAHVHETSADNRR